jgi:enamine deaminase RidA (YjgF/YER057c/UK114 family)
MLQRVNPGGIGAPLANYSHGTLVPPGASWLFVSGQLGVRPDGSVPDTTEAQAAQALDNVLAILAAAGMTTADLVRLNAFLTDPADLATYMRVRDRFVAAPPPASTLVIVQALARPAFRVEVEAVAAKAGTGTA